MKCYRISFNTRKGPLQALEPEKGRQKFRGKAYEMLIDSGQTIY